MDENWRTTGSETVVKDRWINLRYDHCITAGGVEISPYYVLTYPDWTHVVAITDSDSLVLVRQYRHGAGEYCLELPGGAVDRADKDIEQAARRELQEETGYTASGWELITSLNANPATHTNKLHLFLATDAKCDQAQKLDPGEAGLRVEIHPIASVLDGLRSGLIGNALHVSGILLGLAAAGRINVTA